MDEKQHAPPVPSDALATFTEWFCRNYPGPDTIIHKPEWHAPKVFRAAESAIARQAIPEREELESAYADAISGLRYIEQQHGRLYGVGWDRLYAAAERLRGGGNERIT
jgi:hypothetical protein